MKLKSEAYWLNASLQGAEDVANALSSSRSSKRGSLTGIDNILGAEPSSSVHSPHANGNHLISKHIAEKIRMARKADELPAESRRSLHTVNCGLMRLPMLVEKRNAARNRFKTDAIQSRARQGRQRGIASVSRQDKAGRRVALAEQRDLVVGDFRSGKLGRTCTMGGEGCYERCNCNTTSWITSLLREYRYHAERVRHTEVRPLLHGIVAPSGQG
jgi:hypothetical protein